MSDQYSLAVARVAASLSQDQLASKANCSLLAIRQAENAVGAYPGAGPQWDLDVHVAERIAAALGTTVAALL